MTANSQQQTSNSPTPLRGWVSTFYVIKGAARRGPYYVRCWKQGGKIHKEYIKHADLDRVRAACQLHREKRAAQSACQQETYRLIANLKYLNTLCKREIKGQVTPEDHAFVEQLEKLGYSIPGRPLLRKPSNLATENQATPRFMVPLVTNFRSGPLPSLHGRGRGWVSSCLPTFCGESNHTQLATQLSMTNAQHSPAPGLSHLPLIEGSRSRINPEGEIGTTYHLPSAATHRSGSVSPDPSHLPFTTYHLPPKEMKKLKQTLMRPVYDQRKAETHAEKWSRWLNRPNKKTPPLNLTVALPEWTTREEIDATVDRLSKLLSQASKQSPPPVHSPMSS
jgi:hypothetical protein